jgi:hypothetical protein
MAKKASKKSSKSLGGIKAAAKSVVGAVTGKSKSSGGGKRRNRGPAYWANKVIVMKLKRKYNRLKYAGV